MRLTPVSHTALRVGTKLPFALRDATGTLLLASGTVIDAEAMRKLLERPL